MQKAEITLDPWEVVREIALFIAAALAVRLIFLFLIGRVIDMADAIHYVNMARTFAAGEFLRFDENLPVLYPALGALVHLVVPNWEWSFWIVSLIASSLTVVPIYLLARRLHSQTAARIAAAVVTLWPWLVDYGSRIAPEALAVFLWLSSAYLVVVAVERGGWRIAAAALSLFALHLARPEGTFLMLTAPFAAFCVAYKQPRAHYLRAATLTVACIAVLALYALAMRQLIGTYTVSYRAPMATDLFDYLQRGALEGARTFMRLSFDVLPVMLGPILLVFLGIGLYRDIPPKAPRVAVVLAIFCGVQWTLTVANFSPAPRYIMAVVIVLSLWSAHGIAIAGERLAAWRPRLAHAPHALVAASLFAGLAATLAPELLRDTPQLPREYKLAGAWMRDHLEPGVVICRKPQVGFYANMPTTGPAPEDTPDTLVARAKEIGARYLVLDERYTAQLAPNLKPLLDPAHAPPQLKLHRADLSPYPGARLVVYEFVGPEFHYASAEDFAAMSSHMGPDQRRRVQHKDTEHTKVHREPDLPTESD